ncbi:MAG TPA: asparagine synthase (glutamine-hydrolyzing) [Candidatus Kapabacteria bacterium]|nr:asparagine synthase (glutamine-hydrolyzing) [Candidatus Kapabacteria bacterium]
MCGIAGIINGGSKDELERMALVQAHRGPDDAGVAWFSERSSGLAHRRLSIIDLSPAAHQPMQNASGRRWITFNGEIYNYLDLRAELERNGFRFRSNSDTEVVLAAYDCWGPECVRRFNGMFALGIYDDERHELFIARDHLGVKPLYYSQQGSRFLFASEAKALFEVDGMERSVEPDAVISSLLLLWVPEPKTGFTDVLKLPPGHYAYFRDGRLSRTCYWDVPVHDHAGGKERTEEEYVEELRELLERAVRRQMLADVPVGAFLSGGLDSSLIVALMRRVTNGTISTYTIAFSERDKQLEAMPDDARFAGIVARTFGTDHHEIEATPESTALLPMLLHHLDDPVADGAAINTYLIATAARERGTVVLLNGMGGDEVFGGYRKQLAALMIDRYRHLPGPVRAAIAAVASWLPVSIGDHGLRPVRWAKRFLRSADLEPLEAFMYGFAYFKPEELRALLMPPYNEIPFESMYPVRTYHEAAERVSDLGLMDQMTYLDEKLFLPGLNLLYSDKAAMAASVESRPPLVDVELVEFAARLPARYKINERVQKYLLKRAAEAYLPHEVIYRPKAAFGTPLRAWMQHELARSVRTAFTSPGPELKRFISSKLPLRLLDEHQSGQEDHAHSLWGLYAMAVWLGNQTQGR